MTAINYNPITRILSQPKTSNIQITTLKIINIIFTIVPKPSYNSNPKPIYHSKKKQKKKKKEKRIADNLLINFHPVDLTHEWQSIAPLLRTSIRTIIPKLGSSPEGTSARGEVGESTLQ